MSPGGHVPAGTDVWAVPELFPVVLELCQPRGYSPRGRAVVLAPLCHVGSVSCQGLTALVSPSPPPVFVTFKLEPEPTTVYQGHTAMFQCQAEGDPVPHIQWKGKDKILDPSKLLPRYAAPVPNWNRVRCAHLVPTARSQVPSLGGRWPVVPTSKSSGLFLVLERRGCGCPTPASALSVFAKGCVWLAGSRSCPTAPWSFTTSPPRTRANTPASLATAATSSTARPSSTS